MIRLGFALLLTCGTAALGCVAALAQPRPIDPARSTITVKVFRSGLFSVFAHNHEIRAPIAIGSADETARTVELSVRAADLRVLDPDASPKDRAQVQSRMEGPEVLDAPRFPEIRFRSTAVQPLGDGRWRITGDLTLHGVTRPVLVDVTGGSGHYTGTAALKQRDFAMKPVRIAGGAVSVKDEIRLAFDVALR
jgi:polyisoprenoid-binding protein YceI